MTDPLRDPNHPDRPQHEDFWHLSELVLQLDGQAREGREDVGEVLAGIIDQDSIVYMAFQRTLRAITMGVPLQIAASGIYLEAFIMGYRFYEKYGKTQKGAS